MVAAVFICLIMKKTAPPYMSHAISVACLAYFPTIHVVCSFQNTAYNYFLSTLASDLYTLNKQMCCCLVDLSKYYDIV